MHKPNLTPIVIALGVIFLTGSGYLVLAQDRSTEERVDNSWASQPVPERTDGSIDIPVSVEAAEELRDVLRAKQYSPPQPEPAQGELHRDFGYDAAIREAEKSGQMVRAGILRACRDVPAGATLTVAPSYAALMRDHCKVRDFEIVVDPEYLIDPSDVRSAPEPERPSSASRSKSVTQSKQDACIQRLASDLYSCSASTDYLACEMTGCHAHEWDCWKAYRTVDSNGREKIHEYEAKRRFGKCRKPSASTANAFSSDFLCDPNTGTHADDFGRLVAKVCN